MTITRATAESIMINRRGELMGVAGMDNTTVSGANASLLDCLSYAVRVAGGTVADLSVLTDADVATVLDANIDAFLDVAELRLLMTIQGNMILRAQVSGPFREEYVDLTKMIDYLAKRIGTLYDIGENTITAGKVTLDFMERGDDITEIT